MLFVRNWFKL